MANPTQRTRLATSIADWNRSRARLPPVPDLRGADLRHLDLSSADLTSADLSQSKLDGAILKSSRLEGANLSGASLTSADLARANLTGANLTRADLTAANLTGAALNEANLARAALVGTNLTRTYATGTNLTLSDLTGAVLDGTNLSGALLVRTVLAGVTLGHLAGIDGAVFGDVDLREAAGVGHIPASRGFTVGLDTFNRSRGEVPDRFLREAGLDQLFIDYARASLRSDGPQFRHYSAFLSYSTADQPVVDRVYAHLTAMAIPCWQDKHQLVPGDDLDADIDQALRRADRILLFCSTSSLKSWWVESEITKAVRREQQAVQAGRTPVEARIIIPVDLDGFVFSEECTFKYQALLTSRVAARLNDPDTLDEELDRISRSLAADRRRPYGDRFGFE